MNMDRSYAHTTLRSTDAPAHLMTGHIRSVAPFTLSERIRSDLAFTHSPARGSRLSPFPPSLQEESDRRTMRDKYMVETAMTQ